MRIVAQACQLMHTPYFRWNESTPEDLHASDPFCQELGDIIIESYRRDGLEKRRQNLEPRGEQVGDRGLEAFTKRLRSCIGEGFNGKIWLRGRLGHTCRSLGCCGSRAEAEAKGIACVHFLFRSIPGLPEISKWAKLLPVLLMIMSCSVGGLLEEAFEESKNAFKFQQKKPSPASGNPEDASDPVENEWQALAGSRFKRCLQLLRCPVQIYYICTLAVVVEPLRILHSRFMFMSHQVKTNNKVPSIFNELDETRSIVVRVLQYYSSLLGLSCGRARLLWQWSDAENSEEWIRDFPEQALTTRRLILAASAGVVRRLSKLVKEFPWLMLSLGDLRREDGRSVAEKFVSTSWCCLPPGLARMLHTRVLGKYRGPHTSEDHVRGLSVNALISPAWRHYFFGMPFSIFGSIACVEKRHRHHRSLACPQLQWHKFAALSVVGKAQRLHDGCAIASAEAKVAAAQAAIEDQDGQGEPQAAIEDEQPRKLLRAQSPLTLFKEWWLQMESANGRRWNPATAACWQQVRDAYDALSAEERNTFEIEAAATKETARANRRERREPQSLQLRAQVQHALQDGAQEVAVDDGQPPALMPLGAACASGCHLATTATQSASAPPPSFDGSPIGPDALQQYFAGVPEPGGEQRPRRPRLARREEQSWETTSKAIAVPAVDGPQALPAKVKYATQCGALCMAKSTQRERRLHASLVDKFKKLTLAFSPSGKAAGVARGNIVLVVECFLDGAAYLNPADEVVFVALVDAAGRCGRFPDVQMFTKLVPAFPPVRYPYDGLSLTTSHVPFVEPAEGTAPYPPLDQAVRGRVDVMDADELAAALLTCGEFGGQTEKVVIKKLLWIFEHQGQDLGGYITKGIDNYSLAHVARPTDVPDHRPVRADNADVGAGLGMDFLADMAASIRNSNNRPKGAQTPSGSSRLTILDAIGDHRDELSALMAEIFDEDALGEELFGLVHENNEQVKTEESERALEEADIVDFEEPLEEPLQEKPPPPPAWSNMYESPPDSHRYKSTATGKEIGRIHFISGHAKATCKAHKSCVCYVTTPRNSTLATVVVDVQAWLNEFVLSEQDHYAQACRLKRDKYGMRLRS